MGNSNGCIKFLEKEVKPSKVNEIVIEPTKLDLEKSLVKANYHLYINTSEVEKVKFNVGKKKYIFNVGKKKFKFNVGKKKYIINVGKKKYIFNVGKKKYIFNVGKKKYIFNVRKKKYIFNVGKKKVIKPSFVMVNPVNESQNIRFWYSE